MTKLLHRYIFSTARYFRLSFRVSGLHHCNAHPNPSFYFNVDPARTSLKCVYCSSSKWCEPATTGLQTDPTGFHFEPPHLHCERSIQGHPRLHFELLNFTLIQIRIELFRAMRVCFVTVLVPWDCGSLRNLSDPENLILARDLFTFRTCHTHFFGPQMALGYRLDAISQGPKKSQFPGSTPSFLPS